MKRSRPFSLTEHERSLLLSWLQSPAMKKTMAQRARIVLACADGRSLRAIARRLDISADTVCLWRRRFQDDGLNGLRSRALPGRPRRIDRRREDAILAAIRPGGAGLSSVAAVARASGVSRATVRRLWERRASFAQPGDDATVEPGTLVGIFLEHPLRLVVRVPPRPRGALGAAPVQPSRRRRPERAPSAHPPAAILTALEAFRPEPPAEPAATELPAFLRRVTGALPPATRLEAVVQPWPFDLPHTPANTGTSAHAALAEAPADPPAGQARLRWLRCRTRGRWLTTVGVWIAEAPPAQELALDSVLGHLTDYFATWHGGREPFVWTASAAAGS